MYNSPTSVLATQVGTYTWHAHYSGDTNNNGADDNGTNEGVITVKAARASPPRRRSNGGVVGSSFLSDVATLSGGYAPLTGSIIFTLTTPTGAVLPEGSVTVNGTGVYNSPTSVLATQVGTYTWDAH